MRNTIYKIPKHQVTMAKKKKKIVQQSEHEFYIGNGIFYNRDDWNPESA